MNAFFIVTVVSLLTFVTGCDKPPTEKLIKAEKTIELAKKNDAAFYAEEPLSMAEDSLKKAKAYVKTRNYKDAATAAEDAMQFAQQTISITEHNKAKLKNETEKIITNIQDSLDEIEKMKVKVIRKKLKGDYDKVDQVLAMLDDKLKKIKEKVPGQNIKQVYDEAKELDGLAMSEKKKIKSLLKNNSKRKKSK